MSIARVDVATSYYAATTAAAAAHPTRLKVLPTPNIDTAAIQSDRDCKIMSEYLSFTPFSLELESDAATANCALLPLHRASPRRTERLL